MSVDYNSINKHIKDLHAESLTLDEDTGSTYVESLRFYIIGANKLDKINSIMVLAKILDFLPQSDSINNLFDSRLFEKIFEVASSESATNESLRSVLRVSLTFLSGIIPINRPSDVFNALLFQAHSNAELIENISNKLFDQDLRIISNIIDFITKILYRSYELKDDNLLISTVTNLMNAQFFTKLSIISDSNKAELERLGFLKNLGRSVRMVENYLKSLKLNANLEIHQKLLYQLLETITLIVNETGKATAEEYVNFGLSTTPSKFLVENYSVLTAIEMVCFLKSSNITFKKQYFEHTMFANQNAYFPLGKFALSISKLLSEINLDIHKDFSDVFYVFNAELFYRFVLKSLSIWTSSRAEVEDYEKSLKLLYVVLDYANELLATFPLDDVLESINDLEYKELKKYQLHRLRDDKASTWAPYTISFYQEISKQALNFVMDQRFLELSKGSWVYTENPNDLSKMNKKSNYYFIMLSSNNKSLIYKEFVKKVTETPNIDKDGIKIEFNQILRIESTPLTSDASSSKLISINSRLNLNKVEIFTKSKKHFAFYVDTKELLYVWLDGLKMLINDNSDLSEDTKYQLDSLTKVRSDIQLIDLSDKLENMGEVKFKDSDLVGLTTSFYYN